MILWNAFGTESHPAYKALEASNGVRQYDFLRSLVETALHTKQCWLSHEVIKSLNYHAITCLHISPGAYRPCEVTVGEHNPVPYYAVPTHMDSFINQVNSKWASKDPIELASFVLWQLNYIHPFINGNGRTARAAAYFVLCTKLGGLLPGEKLLPELLRENREEYIAGLKFADQSFPDEGSKGLSKLHDLISRLVDEQVSS